MGKYSSHNLKIPVDAKNASRTVQEQYFNATDDMILDHFKWIQPFFHHPSRLSSVLGSSDKRKPIFFVYQWNDRSFPLPLKLQEHAIQQDGLFQVCT
jgi:hypothetical protein